MTTWSEVFIFQSSQQLYEILSHVKFGEERMRFRQNRKLTQYHVGNQVQSCELTLLTNSVLRVLLQLCGPVKQSPACVATVPLERGWSELSSAGRAKYTLDFKGKCF